jgi:MFS family permease
MNDACKRNIWVLNIYTIFLNSIFILPIILPFYRDELRLSFHDFLIGESVFALVVILCDVPAGYLADRWGRRKTLILGAFVTALSYSLLAMATGFWSALLAQGAIGVGIATVSGANSALLYDSLLSAGREGEYRQREGFRFALQLYSCSLACIIGGYLYAFNHHAPLIIEIILIALGGCVAFFFVEPHRHRAMVEKHPLRDIYDTLIYVLHGHREIAGIVLLMVIVFSTTKICMWGIQAYADALHIPETYNGWIISAVMLCGALSGHFGHKILPHLRGQKALQGLIFMLVSILLVAGFSMSFVGIAALGLEAFVYGFGMPRAQESINNLVDSSRRATVLSTANLATSLGFIPLSQMVGVVTDKAGINTALIAYAATLVFLAGVAKLITVKRAL